MADESVMFREAMIHVTVSCDDDNDDQILTDSIGVGCSSGSSADCLTLLDLSVLSCSLVFVTVLVVIIVIAVMILVVTIAWRMNHVTLSHWVSLA